MHLTVDQADALKESINIGVGRAASVLSEMLDTHIRLRVPFIKIFSMPAWQQEVEEIDGERLAYVELKFTGWFCGTAILVFSSESALNLVDFLTDEVTETSDFDSVRAGTLIEVGNIVLNGVMGSISNLLNQQLSFSIPTYMTAAKENLLGSHNSGTNPVGLFARTHFTIEQLQIGGNILILFDVDSLTALLTALEAISPNPGE